ncbi:hypothetical protein MKY30_16185 [Oceanobacillus sp. FSL W8-0428]|uniref:hypothetical protein n=1 Tax=Oceanobacillus sp. FSL W8-0428 TaxID=2921715 RepID=UPI0030F91B2F
MLNEKKNLMLVYEEEIIRRMMQGYGKPFLENFKKYKRSNKNIVVISSAGEGRKLIIRKEDLL